MTRLRWNISDELTGLQKRVSIVGATVVGTTIISHGRTDYMSWGVTAINPDISDVFVEYLRDERFLSTNKTWE